MDTGLLPKDENGIAQSQNDVQPMVNEESREVQSLEAASTSVFNMGVFLMVLQFLLTYILSTSLSFFWDLINS